MHTIKPLIGILIMIFMVGCLPNATTYYRPSVDIESVYEKGHCVPTEKYVHFKIKTKNQTLKIRGYGNTYSTSSGEFSEAQYVIIGVWNNISYKNDDYFIVGSDSNEKVKSQKIYEKVNVSHTDSSLMFNSSAVFPKQNGDGFDVYFPLLIIDGEEIELPVLHIEKKIWMGISPFNC